MAFEGVRPGRKWVFVLGCVVAAGLIGSGIWLLAGPKQSGEGPGMAPWLEFGGILILVVTGGIAKAGRSGLVELVPNGDLQLSWRSRPLSTRNSAIVLGRWNDRLSAAQIGLFVEVAGVRIGGRGSDESGWPLNAGTEWKVDIELNAGDFAKLLASLGARPTGGNEHGFVADLPANSYRGRNALIAMGLVFILPSLIFGYATLTADDSMAFADRLEAIFESMFGNPGGVVLYSALFFLLFLATVYWPRVFALVVGRPPGLKVLHVRPDDIVLAKAGGSVIAMASWQSVSVRPRAQLVNPEESQSYRLPILAIGIGSHKPILFGPAHTVRNAVGVWPVNATPVRRSADYLLGEPHWWKLLATLEAKRLATGLR